MRINEACEHMPIQPYPPEEPSVPSGCNKVASQCVDIAASLTLNPTAVMGTPTVTCQGSPCVTCSTDCGSTSCTLTFKQQVCVSVPIRYGVTMASGEPSIECTEENGCCHCGC
ncbi:hypothetical protein [uncultured Oscillibacter sp.]|uniref:hypothetical protein n=1 Tax=uncultured Oscillibacter sp. TaxID=876091 RepID=UPI0025CE2B61|nr:hypothetical protein [uncultured Oscillibacter sp.]